jgi:L-fuconolactonase
MQRIDAHQHFWIFDPVRDSWINDEMAIIQRDFLPGHLGPVLASNNFDGCVAVQADQSENENTFLLDLAVNNNFIKGIVGWVDLQSPAIEQRLEHYQQFKYIKGFRHVLQGEEDRALMLKPAFMNGISKLAQFGFTYDVLIFPDQLRYANQLASSFPNQRFVIDHIAKPPIKNQTIDQWADNVRSVARNENVYCKVSGMVTEADWKTWKYADFVPYLDIVFEAFSIDRLMYGSDWPVCQLAATYKDMLGIVQQYVSRLSANEQAQFFGTNATNFYSL